MSYFDFPHTRTYDSDLGWLIKSVKKLIECCEDMQGWRINHEAEYNQLKALYDAIMSGNFPPEIQEAFSKWMRENALSIVGDMVKTVIFGLTDDGHFVAIYSDSWRDITFNTTGLDIWTDLQPQYGHLTLSI